ncbi:dihydroorotase [Patescibacteria group bacterium]|nr:dihydroorotase [Patescibacteria group bacterium]
MKLVFKNVTIVNAYGREVRDVFVSGDKIVSPFDEEDARVINGEGKFLIPGVIDPHVHFREPGATLKEDFESGSLAAAVGGVTTVLDMPNNSPAITTAELLEEKRDLVKGRSHVNYGFHFGATGDNNEEIKKARGIKGVKVYMGSSTGDLLVSDSKKWVDIFKTAKEVDVPVVVHAENEERIRSRMDEFSGRTDAHVHTEIRDCECAKIALSSAIAVRKKVGNKLHVAHMSCAEEVLLIKNNLDSRLSCEATPHHLFFSEEDMVDSFLKMNPPLRSAEDMRTLWEAVRGGTVNCLATDHAPHTVEEKSRSYLEAPAGVPGVEFLLPLMLNEVKQNMLGFEQLVGLLSAEAARIFGLKGKGEICEGMDADLVLVDMEKEMKITRNMVRSKCGWSPYEGYLLKGWPVITVVNGEIVVEQGKVTEAMPGREVD